MSTFFDASYVFQVDQQTNPAGELNYLFRGNVPVKQDGTFAYDDLNGAFQALLAKENSGFDLSDYQFFDVSLLMNSGTNELPQWKIEMEAFDVKPSDNWGKFPQPPYTQSNWSPETAWGTQVLKESPGSIVWWPLQPGHDVTKLDWSIYLGPPPNPPSMCGSWNLQGLIPILSNLVKGSGSPSSTQKSVTYFHCENGVDRTGTVHLAYLLANGCWSNGSEPMATLCDACDQVHSIGADKYGWPNADYQALIVQYAKLLGRTSKESGPCPQWSG